MWIDPNNWTILVVEFLDLVEETSALDEIVVELIPGQVLV